MKDFIIITLAAVVTVLVFRLVVPSRYVEFPIDEVHVGEAMDYDTNLGEEIEAELKLLKLQNAN